MLLVAAIGLFLPWATGSISAGLGIINAHWSTTGIDAHPDGIIYLLLLIATGVFAAWNLLAGNRNISLLLFLGWIALLAMSVYEIFYISAKSGYITPSLAQTSRRAASVRAVEWPYVCSQEQSDLYWH